MLTRLTGTCLAVRSKTKYSPGLAEASWPKRERAGSRSATSSKPHGIPTKVRGKKIESRCTCCCIKTSTPSNYCNRYAIRANARVLYSLVNLLFSATGVPVPTYLLDSQSKLVPFTRCRRVLFPTFGAETTVFGSHTLIWDLQFSKSSATFPWRSDRVPGLRLCRRL